MRSFVGQDFTNLIAVYLLPNYASFTSPCTNHATNSEPSSLTRLVINQRSPLTSTTVTVCCFMILGQYLKKMHLCVHHTYELYLGTLICYELLAVH